MKLEKLDNTLLVVGNLGELKIYKIKYELTINPKDNAKTSHKHHKGTLVEGLRFELVNDEAFVEAHKKISDIVTDKQGHFEGPFGGVSGDGHNLEIEIVNRLLKLIANEINRVVSSSGSSKWFLAFPQAYNKELLMLLNDDIKKNLEKNIAENLVKLPPEKIIQKYILT
ncbi:MAG: host attachment protein [Epsilonproteobacteria bacterium]|nr:host attachment protein [Campylobacterota bacterium]